MNERRQPSPTPVNARGNPNGSFLGPQTRAAFLGRAGAVSAGALSAAAAAISTAWTLNFRPRPWTSWPPWPILLYRATTTISSAAGSSLDVTARMARLAIVPFGETTQ